jgi:alpha-1,6-mannosyltransferase
VDRHPLSSRIALGLSVLSVALVATVAATPSSPFQPVLPSSAGPSGPFRWLSGLVALDQLSRAALATIGMIAVAFAALAFVLVLRAAWRGEISFRAVLGLTLAYHAVVLLLPLLFSRDVYSYAYIGRIAGAYHANPYVLTPSDFPRDPLAAFVGPKWVSTPAVYGPLFTLISSGITRAIGSVAGWIVGFRLLATAASLGTIALVARLSGRLMPTRRAFSVAALGLNPVVLFQSVGSGHNDLLVALGVAGAFALLVARRELLATVALALATLVKVVAAIPLALLVVAVVARRPREERARALVAHVGVALGVGLLFAAPFLQTKDPTLGMAELAGHEGWLAPSRLFRRALDAISGDTLGMVSRVLFGLVLVIALVAIARWLLRRGSELDPMSEGVSWGWGLVCLMLLGPVLLPWYVTWALPLVWLLPGVPRSVLLGASVALGVSQFSAEPARFPGAFDANLFVGHYVLTPVIVVLLGWLLLDLWRRLRAGTPLEDEPREVSAAGGER